MAQAQFPAQVPLTLQALLRRDGEWLRCNEPGCGDFAYWGVFRPADFLRVKVAAHRAKVHAGRAPRPQAGRPQRRNAQGAFAAPAGWLVNAEALAALMGARLGEGVARAGFELADTIVKRAHRGQERHNRAEWESYMTAPASVRKYLCPPVMMSPDGSLLVVRRAQMHAASPAQVAELRSALQRHNVHDLHGGNIGVIDGQVVATDYAQGVDGSVIRWAR